MFFNASKIIFLGVIPTVQYYFYYVLNYVTVFCMILTVCNMYSVYMTKYILRYLEIRQCHQRFTHGYYSIYAETNDYFSGYLVASISADYLDLFFLLASVYVGLVW